MTLPDPNKIPRHIAVIMDGNGRWAKQRNLPRLQGHHQGTKTVEDIVSCCQEIGIQCLTLFGFSQENWKRPPDEVAGLMQLLCEFLTAKRPELIEKRIRLKIIGDTGVLPETVNHALSTAIESTRDCDAMTLVLALSYGSRSEMLRAAQKILKDESFKKLPSTISLDPEIFAQYLDTAGLPDPDLLIRTSGEHRLSNFLLWQMAYTELYFTDTLWPDFTRKEFLKAIEEYQKRERRFGLTSEQLRDVD